MKHYLGAEYQHVRIRPLRESDIESLREWRNNQDMSTFLRSVGTITPEMQKRWYENYLEDETIVTFAIEETQKIHRMVGSVAIYNFDGDTAEVGKIVVGDPQAKGKKIGYYGLILAMYVGYQKMNINTFVGSVHEQNMPAKINDLQAGFQVTGKHPFPDGGFELEIILPKKHFEETHEFLKDIRIFEGDKYGEDI